MKRAKQSDDYSFRLKVFLIFMNTIKCVCTYKRDSKTKQSTIMELLLHHNVKMKSIQANVEMAIGANKVKSWNSRQKEPIWKDFWFYSTLQNKVVDQIIFIKYAGLCLRPSCWCRSLGHQHGEHKSIIVSKKKDNKTNILSFSSELLRCLIDIIIILQKAIYRHEIFPKYIPPWFVEKI